MNKGFKRFLSVLIMLGMFVSMISTLAEDTPVPEASPTPTPESIKSVEQTNVDTEETDAPSAESMSTPAPENLLPSDGNAPSESTPPSESDPLVENVQLGETESTSGENQSEASPAPSETTAADVSQMPAETHAPEDSQTPEESQQPVIDLPFDAETDQSLFMNELAPAADVAGMDGTTEKIDASTVLPDGEYTPSDFTFSGGTGKTRITCSRITVSGGQAKIFIQFSSKNWGYVKASDGKYLPLDGMENSDGETVGSQFEFPVDLNVSNRILALTRAMTDPHEVEYTITATLEEKAGEDDSLNATTEKVDASTTLPNGEYAPSDFTFSGGTGKTKLTCAAITVANGEAVARIQFSSKNWGYVKANGDKYLPLNGAENQDGHVVGSQFEFPIDLNVPNRIYGLSRAMTDPHEIEYSITATLEEKAAEPTYEDGDYEPDAATVSSLAMFNITGTSVKVVGGKIMLTIVTEPTGTQTAATYNKIYLGSRRDDGNYESEKIVEGVENGKNGYNYTFEISEDMLGQTIDFVCCSAKSGKWSTSKTQHTLKLPASINQKVDVEPTPTPSGEITDGEYTVDVDTGEKMFKVVGCKLTAKGGKYTAEILLSGTGYDYLYLGSASNAAGAQDKWIKFSGVRDYTVDGATKTGRFYVLALDSLGEIPVAAHSESKDQWYDRKFSFKMDTLHGTGDPNPTPTPAPEGAFGVTDVSATKDGGLLNVILTSSSSEYDRIYIGPMSQWNRSPYYVRRTMLDGTYYYSFTLPASYLNTDVKFVPGRSDGTWYTGDQLTFKCAAADKMPETPEPVDPADGTYLTPVQVYVDNGGESYNNNSAFDAVYTEIRVEGNQLHVTVWNRTSFADALYIGKVSDANVNFNIPRTDDSTSYKGADYRYDFTLPKSALGTLVPFVPGKNGKSATSNQLYLAIPRELVNAGSSEQPKPTPTPSGEIADGEYTVDVDTGEKMFRVVGCKLTAKDGKYTAEILLSGTGYDYLCPGVGADAVASQNKWVKYSGTRDYTVDGGTKTGRYYVLSLDSLGETPVAAHSEKNDQWYDRKLAFKLDTLKKIGDVETDPTPTPSPTPTPEPTKAPESDLSGSTKKVDSSTSLKDGTYTPDKFSYSGGTGRVTLSCKKVTVSGGKATATLQFASPSFSYVKASGKKIYGSHTGSSSTFEVPVKLNANNRIIGMTTAMTLDHEVAYTIYIYIEGADANQDGSAGSADAPKVVGLNWESSDVLEHAKNFGVHRYQDGVRLIRVENLVEYLVVPENADLPVGVDEGRVRISQPVEKVYVASEDMLRLLAESGLTEIIDRIAALGVSEEQNPIEALTERIVNGEVALAGIYDAPEYAALLKQSCKLAIMPSIYADPKVMGTDAEAESQLDDDTAAALNAVVERLGMLQIPVFVDLSAQEETEEARLEWIKIYGVIFDCEAAANAAYDRLTAELEQAA